MINFPDLPILLGEALIISFAIVESVGQLLREGFLECCGAVEAGELIWGKESLFRVVEDRASSQRRRGKGGEKSQRTLNPSA